MTTIHQRILRVRGAVGLLLCMMLVELGCDPPSPTAPLEKARELASKGEFEQAEEIVKAIGKDDPIWADAQVVLGDIVVSHRGSLAALPFYEVVPKDRSSRAARAMRAVGELQFADGSMTKAIASFEELLRFHPYDTRIQGKIATFYEMSGLRTRAEPLLLDIINTGRIEVPDLVLLSEPDRPSNLAASIRRRAEKLPADHLSQMGLARLEVAAQNYSDARRRLKEVVKAEPNLPEAQALLGELLLDGELADMEQWHAALPKSAQNDPGVWFVRGLWARQINEPRIAAHCFWQTVRQSPIHRRAFYQLGQVLAPLDAEAGAAYAKRAILLKEYSEVMEQVLLHQGLGGDEFNRMMALLLEMGRDTEAWAWAMLDRSTTKPKSGTKSLLQKLSDARTPDQPRFRVECDVSRQHDLSKYPDFSSIANKRASPSQTTGTAAATAHVGARIQFTDDAEKLGVNFSYLQSPESKSKAVRIFESTGGGVGAFDFDQDGWTDLFFTQGEEWPAGQDQPVPSSQYKDRLYRGLGTQFEDVSQAAGIALDNGYGQGCSCGDFNNDGFADLYVANIGKNQLLQNNGDGTFTDVTEASGLSGTAWTTSCLILDLNMDGNPDLYDVNYLQGDGIYKIECGANRCSVRGYQGAPDQVQLSKGDGTFVDVPDGTPQVQGKGLGIVALFVNGEQRPSLFIANDQVPNFFLRPTNVDGIYSDEAVRSGLALNREGQTSACMGVAAGDLNQDRRTDLYVTNFEGEAKLLYLQRDDGLFEDSIVTSGIMAPGIPFVGWGTQFLDADCNGSLDLVATNGHVADFGESGVTYRMPTQFFRNQGQGRMRLENPMDVGKLFDRRDFGRALATCDWNRDGRIDFVLSNIGTPAIIATNQTQESGHWLTVRLHATTTARDAVGATVEVHQGSTVHWRQLLAGDGYQATNERHLHFGLGANAAIDRVIVHWPSGTASTYDSIPADRNVTLVEGRESAFYTVRGHE